jgi:ATP-dependent Clp protease adapter protein ClpS
MTPADIVRALRAKQHQAVIIDGRVVVRWATMPKDEAKALEMISANENGIAAVLVFEKSRVGIDVMSVFKNAKLLGFSPTPAIDEAKERYP